PESPDAPTGKPAYDGLGHVGDEHRATEGEQDVAEDREDEGDGGPQPQIDPHRASQGPQVHRTLLTGSKGQVNKMPARRAANSRRCDNTATMVRLLLVAALLLACNKPPGNDRPGASGLEAGSPCTLNAECRAGLICDPARRRCVCTGDDACP